jgi:hypothetical protein
MRFKMDDDEINNDVLDGTNFPTDKHLFDEKKKWNKLKSKWRINF